MGFVNSLDRRGLRGFFQILGALIAGACVYGYYRYGDPPPRAKLEPARVSDTAVAVRITPGTADFGAVYVGKERVAAFDIDEGHVVVFDFAPEPSGPGVGGIRVSLFDAAGERVGDERFGFSGRNGPGHVTLRKNLEPRPGMGARECIVADRHDGHGQTTPIMLRLEYRFESR